MDDKNTVRTGFHHQFFRKVHTIIAISLYNPESFKGWIIRI